MFPLLFDGIQDLTERTYVSIEYEKKVVGRKKKKKKKKKEREDKDQGSYYFYHC